MHLLRAAQRRRYHHRRYRHETFCQQFLYGDDEDGNSDGPSKDCAFEITRQP